MNLRRLLMMQATSSMKEKHMIFLASPLAQRQVAPTKHFILALLDGYPVAN